MSKLLIADPHLLALPPLKPGEEQSWCTGQRRICQIPASLPSFGPGYNLFGTHDIRGRGTNVPVSPHCDPFVLCSGVKMSPKARPPFCAHPHCGASVASILLQGSRVHPWDNLNGPEKEVLLPGGIYHVNTGSGCVHDEPFDLLGLHGRTKASFEAGVPGEPVAEDAPTWFVQLWWNPLDMQVEKGATTDPVCTQVVRPEAVPLVVHQGLAIRVLAGSYHGCADVLTSNKHPLLLLHVRVRAGESGNLCPLPLSFNGFLWVVDGTLRVGGTETDRTDSVTVSHGANGMLLLPPGGDSLFLGNDEDATPTEVLIALGEPKRQPYFKYVGYGGGFIHRSAEAVQAAMSEYEQNPKEYGRKALESKAAVDMSKYTLVPGFQENGGDMMERPGDVVARFSYKPSET